MNTCQVFILALAAVVTVAGSIAFHVGFRAGKNAGWCERYYAELERQRVQEKRRLRGTDGQFRAREDLL